MAATTHTDDAYNKLVESSGPGTLISNWQEEWAVRQATGQGRSIPQRHLKRSGLLTTWKPLPEGRTKLQDDTFERVCGKRVADVDVTTAGDYGSGGKPRSAVEVVVAPSQSTLPKVGPRTRTEEGAFYSFAKEQVTQEVADDEMRRHTERCFVTSTGSSIQLPPSVQPSLEQRALEKTFAKEGKLKELACGKTADTTSVQLLANAGLELVGAHYAAQVPVTRHTELAAMPGATAAAQGQQHAELLGLPFVKKSAFSQPIQEYLGAQEKAETGPARVQVKMVSSTEGQWEPGFPSLSVMKQMIRQCAAAQLGPRAFLRLRSSLLRRSDSRGLVTLGDATDILRNNCGVTEQLVAPRALSLLLSQLATMSKQHCRPLALVDCLQPHFPGSRQAVAVQLYAALGSPVSIGQWARQLPPHSARTLLAWKGLGEFPADDEDVQHDDAVLKQLDSLPMVRRDVEELVKDAAAAAVVGEGPEAEEDLLAVLSAFAPQE